MSTEQHEERRRKVAALRSQGVDPYPVGFEQTAEAAELHDRFEGLEAEASTGETVSVAGRLMGKCVGNNGSSASAWARWGKWAETASWRA